ncbi:MAG: phosphate/phosphite/phosphonate ABC transporter substrate-binding protein [Phycisphaerales bacterium]|nr:MAG: phosphate/phosphite/phosphonate ABC transporter substrate-binding protein [Phycisphaerales bacterium]
MKQRRKSTLLVLFTSLCAVMLAGILIKWFCRSRTPVVSFSEWIAVKPIEAEDAAFRFAVASMVSAEETWATYRKLVDYVATRIGDRASMVLRPSYSDVRILLEQGKVDVAFVCTGTYIACSQLGSVELLAVPEFKDDAKYRSLFIVREDSTVNTVADLRGKTFAFTDPESNTGCVVPSWLVSQQGINPEAFFSKIVYTGSHDRSLHAVVRGVVEGASVHSLVYYSFARTHPELKERLRAIWQSEAFGAPPIVVPFSLPTTTKEKLRTVFLSMSQKTPGRAILDGLSIECFRMPEEDEYDSAREIWKATNRLK